MILHVIPRKVSSRLLSGVKSRKSTAWSCFIWNKNALYLDRSSSHSPAERQIPLIRICKIFSNFAVTTLTELIILGGFNEKRYVTSGYFNGHLSMSLAVMAEGSCTHSVLKVSTASSLMVLLSVTDFSDRGVAKPNSTCLQCTWFFLSQGSIAASFGYKSACSRTSFLMKRPIKVSKRLARGLSMTVPRREPLGHLSGT